jgi:hypothetical protein
MTLKTLIDKISDSIQEDIKDPNPDRWSKNKRWVYTTPVNVDLPSYPRVHVQEVSGPRTPLAVNSFHRKANTRVQISILWSITDKYDSTGQGKTVQPEAGLNQLTEQIEDYINVNQELWTDVLGVWMVRSMDVFRVPSSKNTLIRNDLDIEVIWRTGQ